MKIKTTSFVLYHALDELLNGAALSEQYRFTAEELANAIEIHRALGRIEPSTSPVTLKLRGK